MKYQRAADWYLLRTCNYRCTYCFFSDSFLGSKLKPIASASEWRDAFCSTGQTWLLHLTGGEPSIYPDFPELCDLLSQDHYLSVNSNLTHPSINSFAERVHPSRVHYVNAGLHPTERSRHSGYSQFIRHADLLRKKGFPLFVSLVATPDVLARFEDSITLLRSSGLFPIPKLLRGNYNGLSFPKG